LQYYLKLSNKTAQINNLFSIGQCFPSNITGRGVRIDIDGKKSQKVCLDPLDKEMMEHKLAAITHCYHKLTTHRIGLGFSKPTLFQQKTLEQRERAKAK